ncbi:hypothetical protein EB796_003101 [Bugula neritina]|uniref:Uncharacterized protein n=1 Tax=Bugula neritina TaxID=10212 RepID=A0A7J7KKP1_BUGNE|nr:hypothetical protein EB796_003101 [Bugula neritina]
MSLVYVIYQAAQFFASIIGPGTIFMMITGALQVAIKSLSLSDCLIINLIPNLIFVIVSFNVKSSTQVDEVDNIVQLNTFETKVS